MKNDSWLVLGVLGLVSIICGFTMAPVFLRAVEVLAQALGVK